MEIKNISMGGDTLNVTMATGSLEESLAFVARIRAMEVVHNSGYEQTAIPEAAPETEEDAPAPKRGRGRPALSDEEKAAKKAERDAKKAEEKAAKKAADAEAAAHAEAEKAINEAEAAEEQAASAEADEDEPDEDSIEVEGDDEDEPDEDEPGEDVAAEAADEDPGDEDDADEPGIKALLEKVRPLGKLRDVLTELQNAGYSTAAELVDICEDIQADVPALARIKGLKARVARAASVMGID